MKACVLENCFYADLSLFLFLLIFQSVDVICSTLSLCDGLKDTWSPYGDSKEPMVEVAVVSTTTLAPKDDCKDCTTFFKDVQDTITSQETLVSWGSLSKVIEKISHTNARGYRNDVRDRHRFQLFRLK